MLKRFLLLFAFASFACAQTSTVNISVTFQTSVLADLVTHWTDQRTATGCTLAAAQQATDTTLTCAQSVTISAGSTVLIDSEPESVTAVSGSTVTVTRGTFATFGLAAAAHLMGATVYTLTYATPVADLITEALQPWSLNIVHSLAQQNRSVVFTPPTGTITVQ